MDEFILTTVWYSKFFKHEREQRREGVGMESEQLSQHGTLNAMMTTV